MSEREGRHVVVYQQDDGMWRWRWSSGGDDPATLTSSHASNSQGEAQDAARTAYPDTPIVVEEPKPSPARRARARARRLLWRGLTTSLLCLWVVSRARGHRRRVRDASAT
jgi:hypothetical protein